jgi:hypothetical protein
MLVQVWDVEPLPQKSTFAIKAGKKLGRKRGNGQTATEFSGVICCVALLFSADALAGRHVRNCRATDSVTLAVFGLLRVSVVKSRFGAVPIPRLTHLAGCGVHGKVSFRPRNWVEVVNYFRRWVWLLGFGLRPLQVITSKETSHRQDEQGDFDVHALSPFHMPNRALTWSSKVGSPNAALATAK